MAQSQLTAASTSLAQVILPCQIARITGTRHHAWLIFVFLIETQFYHVGQVGLELLTSGDLPTLASLGAGITGVSHHPQHINFFSSTNYEFGLSLSS